MSNTPKPRLRYILAAAALTITLAGSACTVQDWRYDIPVAVGAQADSGPVKARNILLVTDDDGKAVLLGSVAASEAVTLTHIAIQPETADGSLGEVVAVPLPAEVDVPAGEVLNLEGTPVTGIELLPGRLAMVALQFSDGAQVTLDAPIMTRDQPDYANVGQG